LVSETGVFLSNSKKYLSKRNGFPQKRLDIQQHEKIKEQEFFDPHHHHDRAKIEKMRSEFLM